MNYELDHSKKLVEDFFYLFSECYKFPTEEFYEEIKAGAIDRLVEETSKLFETDLHLKFQDVVPSIDVLKKAYMNSFSGITEPFAPPVESLYKVWTDDETAHVSIAKSKGFLMGDSALHMKYLLKQFHLDIPSGYENMPDHLAIQLEFALFLHEHDFKRELAQFIDDHFHWLEDFKKDLLNVSDSSFYVYITEVLIKLLIGFQKIMTKSWRGVNVFV